VNPLYASLSRLQKRLADAGIASAVIGGIAVSVWSRPRTTDDVDLKVLLDRDSARRLLDALEPDYIPLQADPLQALRRNGVLFVKDIVRRQGDALDDRYVMKWLRALEQALDDSTLVADYQRLRAKYSS